MAELVDALDLGSSVERRGGSIPSTRTKQQAVMAELVYAQVSDTCSLGLRVRVSLTAPSDYLPIYFS